MRIYSYEDMETLPEYVWRDVREELPPIGSEVLVYCPKRDRRKVRALVRMVSYEGDEHYYWDAARRGDCTLDTAVSHWRLMPRPPAYTQLIPGAST